jgi:hypothetical protein
MMLLQGMDQSIEAEQLRSTPNLIKNGADGQLPKWQGLLILHLAMESSPDSDRQHNLSDYRHLIRRLGKHAQRILLLAPGPDENPVVIPREDPTPSANASYYQALRRLEADGLISIALVSVPVEQNRTRSEWEWNPVLGDWVEHTVTRIPSWRRKRAVRLTPLGAAIVGEMREFWESKAGSPPQHARH